MKKIFVALVLALASAASMAQGMYYHGYRGGYEHQYHGGDRFPAFVAGAIVGSALYELSRPAVVVAPPVVVQQAPVVIQTVPTVSCGEILTAIPHGYRYVTIYDAQAGCYRSVIVQQ